MDWPEVEQAILNGEITETYQSTTLHVTLVKENGDVILSIEPEIDEVYLDHGERVKFNIQISVPADVRPGGYYAGVLAAVRSAGGNNENVELINRVGTSILMSIPGKAKEDPLGRGSQSL